MDEGVYAVIDVQASERRDEKELVRVEGGMRGFLADIGEYSVGDMVEVEQYEDYKGETSYRVVGMAKR